MSCNYNTYSKIKDPLSLLTKHLIKYQKYHPHRQRSKENSTRTRIRQFINIKKVPIKQHFTVNCLHSTFIL